MHFGHSHRCGLLRGFHPSAASESIRAHISPLSGQKKWTLFLLYSEPRSMGFKPLLQPVAVPRYSEPRKKCRELEDICNLLHCAVNRVVDFLIDGNFIADVFAVVIVELEV